MDLLVMLGHFEDKPISIERKPGSTRLARKSVDSSSESFGKSLPLGGSTKITVK